MNLKDENLVCSFNECMASLVDKAITVTEERILPRASGSNSKKVYHSPVLTVYGKGSDLIHLEVDFRKIKGNANE